MANSEEKNINRLLQQRFGIIGKSKLLQDALSMVTQAAPTDLTVLITGETGTGKEVFSAALHGLSKRKNFPFVSVNCGAIPETLLESELFGHEKGAFTGAIEQRKGFFEVANKGTIFLDEIGEMPYSTQVKLLRVLESGEFTRVGSTSIQKVDVRIIAATNRKLEIEVEDGNFRQDLFFRLNSIHIVLPPLRNHPEDIPLLVEFFAQRICQKLSLHFSGISDDALGMLKTLPWKGNTRELRNLIETIVTLEAAAYITPQILRKYLPAQLPPYLSKPLPDDKALVSITAKDETGNFEMSLIFRTLLQIQNDVNELKISAAKLSDSVSYLTGLANSNIEDSKLYTVQDESEQSTEIKKLAELEKDAILKAIQQFDGNRRSAAKSLGISERTLYRKLSDYSID